MNFIVTILKRTQGTLGWVSLRCCLWLGLSLILVGCNSLWVAELTEPEQSHSLMARLEHESSQSSDHSGAETPSQPISIDDLLTELAYVPVQSRPGAIPPGASQFHTLARKAQLSQYPCSNCHTEPLEVLQKNSGLAQQAHWDINLNHADESIMTCLTCHTADDMDTLHSLTGQAIDLDHSYQLCAQCHGQQYDDWQGGAHGKRVGGWAPPRVVNNCVDCHNPHQPTWDTRWPAVTNASE